MERNTPVGAAFPCISGDGHDTIPKPTSEHDVHLSGGKESWRVLWRLVVIMSVGKVVWIM